MLFDISSIYEGTVWRPPSEAKSLILQATVGCSWNRCTFCVAFLNKKFRIKTLEELKADIGTVIPYFKDTKRVFLADGNALCIPTDDLVRMLKLLYDSFPGLERVGIYGGPLDITEKSVEELKALREAGLSMVYLGLESGSDMVLKKVRKGAGPKKMIGSARRLKEAGLVLSAIIIQGLGGKELMVEHATGTARVLSLMDPEYIGALTLMVCEGTQMEKDIQEGRIHLLSSKEVLEELKLMVTGLEVSDCVFRANHPSNYVAFKGTLPQDKDMILTRIDEFLRSDDDTFRPEWLRGL